MSKTIPAVRTHAKLHCERCGGDSRFVLISCFVADLVDADGNHLHQLHSEVVQWECAKCGAVAEWREMLE